MTSCFFYGTLMHPKILERVTGIVQQDRTPAVLTDHARFHLRGLDYPGLVFREGCSVAGVLVHSIDDEQLRRLDLFEGDEYVRKEVKVKVNDHGECLCQTYVYLDESVIEDRHWNYEEFEASKSHRWLEPGSTAEFDMLPDADGSRGRAAMIVHA